jgi:hypothetical protein
MKTYTKIFTVVLVVTGAYVLSGVSNNKAEDALSKEALNLAEADFYGKKTKCGNRYFADTSGLGITESTEYKDITVEVVSNELTRADQANKKEWVGHVNFKYLSRFTNQVYEKVTDWQERSDYYTYSKINGKWILEVGGHGYPSSGFDCAKIILFP